LQANEKPKAEPLTSRMRSRPHGEQPAETAGPADDPVDTGAAGLRRASKNAVVPFHARLPGLRRFLGGRGFSAETAAASLLGLIVGAGVMAAAGELSSVGTVELSVLAAVLSYWVAEGYTEALATHLSTQQGFLSELGHRLILRLPMVEVAFAPLVAMLIATALGARESAAINVGLIASVALLFVFGWVGTGRSGLKGFRRWATAVMISALGVVMILLKTYLHTPRVH
jgi:hypothetical protein